VKRTREENGRRRKEKENHSEERSGRGRKGRRKRRRYALGLKHPPPNQKCWLRPWRTETTWQLYLASVLHELANYSPTVSLLPSAYIYCYTVDEILTCCKTAAQCTATSVWLQTTASTTTFSPTTKDRRSSNSAALMSPVGVTSSAARSARP